MAGKYLIRHRYLIIATNVKFREGEIDIIAKKANRLIFVEVKTRTNWNFGYPEAAMDSFKKQKFQQAIDKYIFQNNYQGEWQADLIAIDLKGNQAKLRHYQSIEL